MPDSPRFLVLLFCSVAFAAAAIGAPAAAGPHYDAVVAADGSGGYATVQAAIDAAPANATRPFVIFIKPGVYEGQTVVPKDKPFIHFTGAPGAVKTTVLTYPFNKYEIPPGTLPKREGSGVIVQGGDFRAENITFENTSGDHGQGRALWVDGDRAVFENCRILGWQDTLRMNTDGARLYFKNCFIAGRTDFIYGPATAVFDRCEIHSRNGGHITAASTPQGAAFGFVFLHCTLTGDPTPWGPGQTPARPPMADLGRPWRPYATVAYIECEMGGHIKPPGWDNWNDPKREKTARYSEYKSTGPGANPSARVAWSRQLTDDEAKRHTIENILKGSDGWKP